MILPEFLISFITALLFTIIVLQKLRGQRTNRLLFSFFTLIFLSTWAGGLWILPAGPRLLGISWLPFFMIGFITTILIAALIPSIPKEMTNSNVSKVIETETTTIAVLDPLFWVALLIFVVLIISGYLRKFNFFN